MSRVDVIIPCYQYAHYLRACVESVLAQPRVDVRVLVIDDASPDDTPQVAAALVRQDRRVEYRRHEVNQRHIATYNEGLRWASADYTLLLSADDLLAPGALRRAARVLDRYPYIGLVHGRQTFFDTAPGPAQTPEHETDGPCEVLSGEAFVESCCAVGHNPVATPTAIVRTALQHTIGGYSASLPHTADLEMWLRFAARSGVARLEAHQAYKRMHQANMQYQFVAAALTDLRELQAAFDSFFHQDGRLLSAAGPLQELAHLRVAERAFWAASRAFDDGDDSACRQLLDYAGQLRPDLPARPEWSRLRWKRRLGARGWSLLHPWVERFRRKKSDPVSWANRSLTAAQQ
jgi:glycosyltransferase involved in cell wall biosynthesis